MKKVLVLFASFLLLASGCKTKSEEKALADFNAKMTEYEAEYNANATRIKADTTLTEEQRYSMYDQNYETIAAKMRELIQVAIEKYPSGKIAVEALKQSVGIFEIDALEKIMQQLKGEAAKDAYVLELKLAIQKERATAEGRKFTDFTVVQDASSPETSTVHFSDYVGRGKYVLVDFWASWCGPCKREIPNIAAVYEKYHGNDFDVLSIAVWDKPEDTKASALEHGVVWSQIINAQKIPTDIYGIEGIPHIMLIGPDGTILKRNLRGEMIEKAVAEALGR